MSEELLNQLWYYFLLDFCVITLVANLKITIKDIRNVIEERKKHQMEKLNDAFESYLFDCEAREQLERYQEQEDLMWETFREQFAKKSAIEEMAEILEYQGKLRKGIK